MYFCCVNFELLCCILTVAGILILCIFFITIIILPVNFYRSRDLCFAYTCILVFVSISVRVLRPLAFSSPTYQYNIYPSRNPVCSHLFITTKTYEIQVQQWSLNRPRYLVGDTLATRVLYTALDTFRSETSQG